MAATEPVSSRVERRSSKGLCRSAAISPPTPKSRTGETLKKPCQPKPSPIDVPPPQKQASEESGTTAGRGSSRGSNKNPASSDWSSKDQVTNPEDEAVEDDEEISYQIVGEDEADIRQGLLSFTSPIARALIGKSEGDEVDVRTPGGERAYEILEVRYG